MAPNTFSDNDNYILQDLSIGYDSGMQHNGYTEDIAKTKNVEKKKQAERKNIHRSFFKTGKEKVRTNNYIFLFRVSLREIYIQNHLVRTIRLQFEKNCMTNSFCAQFVR